MPKNSEMITNAQISFFYGSKKHENEFRESKPRFGINIRQISSSHKNKMSQIFGRVDREFSQLCMENQSNGGENLQDNLTATVDQVYANSHHLQNTLAKKIGVTLNWSGESVKRDIKINEESKEVEEPAPVEQQNEFNGTENLQIELKKIEEKYDKSAHEIAEVFVKLSGDLESMCKYFEGEQVVEWTYLEDLALTKPPDSLEFKCLLETKGKKEIDKRKEFLVLSSQQDG